MNKFKIYTSNSRKGIEEQVDNLKGKEDLESVKLILPANGRGFHYDYREISIRAWDFADFEDGRIKKRFDFAVRYKDEG